MHIKRKLQTAFAKVTTKKIYMYSIGIGLGAGFLALGFSTLLANAEYYTLVKWAGIDLGVAGGEQQHILKAQDLQPNALIFFILPILGAFLSGIVVQYFAPEVAGAGTNATLENYHEKEAIVKLRSPFMKALATLAVLSGAGSAGKEGPISQIGSAFGSLVGQFLGLGPKARRTLFLAGMAGALGAIFRAPIGAAITAVEILYKEDLESESLVPCILSSISGYFVFTYFRGFDHTFKISEQTFVNWHTFIFYTILGLICVIFGAFFVRGFEKIEGLFKRLPLPVVFRVTLGGVIVGCIGYVSHESVGSGFGFLQKLMQEHGSIFSGSQLSHALKSPDILSMFSFLLIVAILRMVATIFTIGSGGSGGVFGPSLVIGGTLGAMVGLVAQNYFPHIVPSYIPFVVVGMGGFFAGVANAPIASMIMVSELTGSYDLLAPMAIVSTISIIFSRRFNIYKEQRINKFDSPAHEWEMTNDFLQRVNVGSEFESPKNTNVIDIGMKVKKLISIANKKNENIFIVQNKEHIYQGVISLVKLTAHRQKVFIKSNESIDILVNRSIPAIYKKDSLSKALDILINHDIDKVAIINEKEIVLGYLTFRDILTTYRRKVSQKK